VREAPERTADGGFAHPHSAHGEEELGPLGVGGPRPLFNIFYEQLPCLLVQLRSSAWGFPRLEGAALVDLLTVAFDRGTIYTEAACGLGLGDALFDRLDDLLS